MAAMEALALRAALAEGTLGLARRFFAPDVLWRVLLGGRRTSTAALPAAAPAHPAV